MLIEGCILRPTSHTYKDQNYRGRSGRSEERDRTQDRRGCLVLCKAPDSPFYGPRQLRGCFDSTQPVQIGDQRLHLFQALQTFGTMIQMRRNLLLD